MNIGQFAFDMDDPFAKLAAVALELGLTRTAQTDATNTLS
jgi:hypothetical protein